MRRPAAALLALLPAFALASGDSVPNVAARDLGIAQSLVAAQDGAGAVYANPAALSRISGLDLSITGAVIDNGTRYSSTEAGKRDAKTKFHPVPGPAVFAAYGGRLWNRGWGVGLGMNVPEGGNVVWPSDWDGKDQIVKVDRRVYTGYLTGGFEVIPQLRVGGGLVYAYSTEEFQLVALNALDAKASTSGGGLSYDLSAEVNPLPGVPLTLAVDYKHKAHQKLDGSVKFSDPTQDQDVTHHFVVPNSVNVGVAYRPIRPLLLAFTWTLDRYRVYQEDRFELSRGLFGLVREFSIRRNYGNGYTLRGGAEYALSPAWQVRAGLLRDHTGQQARYFHPSLPDGDVWAGSAGASYLVPSMGLGVHAGVFYARYDEVDNSGIAVSDPVLGRAPEGKWRSGALIASLGVTWRYGAAR